jgi:hypothetical protein
VTGRPAPRPWWARYRKGILAVLTAVATALAALPDGASWQAIAGTAAAAAIGCGLVVLVPNAKPLTDHAALLRWWQVYSHVLMLSSSERTRQAAHREATREAGITPPRRPQ